MKRVKYFFPVRQRNRKYGVYVIHAAGNDEAEKIAATDPYTAAGLCVFELLEWEVHQILGAGPFSAAEMRTHR